ncbi:MAG: FAD-binding oxidoreductase [Candidatus Bathyarchaeia archaeon]
MRGKVKRLQSVLQKEIGSDTISTSRHERIVYSHDLAQITGPMRTIANRILFNNIPDFIVMPRNTREIQTVITHAYKQKVPVVPRGGGSWGHSSAVPSRGGVVLDLSSMDRILEVDEENLTVKVQAGVKVADLNEYLNRRGLTLPITPFNAPYSTVGGWLSSSALGIGSLKYGSALRYVASLTTISPTGETVQVPGHDYHKGPFDLSALLACSEGTLGVMSEAELRIKPKPEAWLAACYAFNNLREAQTALMTAAKSDASPYHLELLEQNYLHMRRSVGDRLPDCQGLIFAAFEGDNAVAAREQKIFADICEKYVKDKKASEASEAGEVLWQERYNSLKVRRLGPSTIFEDVILPMGRFDDLTQFSKHLAELYRLMVGLHARAVDHNSFLVSPYFLVDERRRGNFVTSLPLVKDVVDQTLRLGGRVYGSGLWNYFYLRYCRGQASLECMKRIKKGVDQRNILNPSKTFRVMPKLRIPALSLEDRLGLPASSIIYNTVLWVASFIIKIIRGVINALYWRRELP